MKRSNYPKDEKLSRARQSYIKKDAQYKSWSKYNERKTKNTYLEIKTIRAT
jgi:hypothetical protein